MTMYSYCRASSRNTSSRARAVAAPGRSNWSEPARMSRPDLCLTTSSRRNSDRAGAGCRARRAGCSGCARRGRARPRRARVEIHDHRRPLAEARELDAAVHRQRRRAGAALGAEEHQRRRLRRRPRRPARAASPHGLVERLLAAAARRRTRWRRPASPGGSHRARPSARRRRCRRSARPPRRRSTAAIAAAGRRGRPRRPDRAWRRAPRAHR